MTMRIGAGALNRPLQVLELKRTPDGFEWVPVRQTWAAVEFREKINLFSRIGIGARDALITVRKQDLSLHNALTWNRTHFFLTSIVGRDRNYLEVRAAAVEEVTCRGEVHRPEGGWTFPAVLTEKYLHHEQLEPMAVNELTYVLVTPKAVELTRGGLVEANGKRYVVQTAHTLDPYKNEYELFRREDL